MKLSSLALTVSLTFTVAVISCDKNDEKSTPRCNVNSGYFSIRNSNFVFALPTAFTPNGDGINDVYVPIATSANVTDYSLVIYNDENNSKVFETTNINTAWNGEGAGNGYKYSVMIRFEDASGKVIDTCSYLFLLRSGEGGCAKFVQANAANYYFPDQFDAAVGIAVYATAEKACY